MACFYYNYCYSLSKLDKHYLYTVHSCVKVQNFKTPDLLTIKS